MAILSITPGITGLAGVTPNLFLIDTNDTFGTVVTTGYLTGAAQEGFSFAPTSVAFVTYYNNPDYRTCLCRITVSAGVYSLVSMAT